MNEKKTNLKVSTTNPPPEKSTTRIQTIRVKEISDLEPFLKAWNELSAGTPMRSSQWLMTWWTFYAGPDDELCVLLFLGPESALVGIAPLYIQNRSTTAIVRLLGSGGDFTHHTTWLAADGYEYQVGVEVARFLKGNKRLWKQLVFEGVDEEAAAVHLTIQHLSHKYFLSHKRRVQSCWKIILPPTWDDYLMMLSPSLRKRCRKLQREFLDSGRIILRQAESEADLKEGFEVLLKLHSARWGRPEKQLGVFSDERFTSFHDSFCKHLLENKSLRLAWLECDSKPLAIEYQFYDNKTLYAYQAGIDLSEDLFSAGKLTMMAAIQFAISTGRESFDFLTGNDPYKMNWRATPVDCYDLRTWKRNLKGSMEWATWHCYTLVSQKLKLIIPERYIIKALQCFQALKSYRGKKHYKKLVSF